MSLQRKEEEDAKRLKEDEMVCNADKTMDFVLNFQLLCNSVIVQFSLLCNISKILQVLNEIPYWTDKFLFCGKC